MADNIDWSFSMVLRKGNGAVLYAPCSASKRRGRPRKYSEEACQEIMAAVDAKQREGHKKTAAAGEVAKDRNLTKGAVKSLLERERKKRK